MTDAEDALREYREALAEHERALAAVSAVRDQLDRARTEYADARHTVQQSEQELESAVAKIAVGLHEMHVNASSSDTSASLTADADASDAADPTASDAAETYVQPADVIVSNVPAIVGSLVEYHRNIGCYHCYLFLADAPDSNDSDINSNSTSAYDRVDASALSVRVAFPHIELHYTTDKQPRDSLWWTTEIERNVEPASCVISVQSDHIHVRLAVREANKDVSDSDAFSAFSHVTPNELDAQQYRFIACRACNNALVRSDSDTTAKFDRVLPLPSANWTDMFDYWGAGLGAFEHLPRDAIFATRKRVYVGESHVLLHASDVVDASFVACEASDGPALEEAEDRTWEPLACANCHAALGARHCEQTETIRLDKHVLVAASTADADSDNVFARYTVDSVVGAQLLEAADSNGVFRFTLQPSSCEAEADGDALPRPLTLQLLSWETQVKTTDASSFRRVLKVLYAPAATDTSTGADALLPGPPAQELVFAPAICAAVAARLQKSSELLPLSLRTFNGQHVGYLAA